MSAAHSIEPRRVETEQALLGLCIIYGSRAWLEASLIVIADDFEPVHARIFAAIGNLTELGHTVDPFTIKAKIGGVLDEIGGVGYLANLAAIAPASANDLERIVRSYAHAVREESLRRRIQAEMQTALQCVVNPTVAIPEAIAPVIRACEDATARLMPRRSSTAEAGMEMASALERASRGETVPFVTTGIPAIDKEMGGFQAGELVIVAGRPGMGKSAFLFNALYRAALSGIPAIGFSLEMRQEALLQRMACDIDYDINAHDPALVYMRCRTPERLSRREIERYAEAMAQLPPSMHIYDDGGMTMEKISSVSRKRAAEAESRIGVVVIDYLQKVQASDRYAGSRVQEVTEIVGKAKTLAMALGWPVVCGCQLNRAVEGRTDRFPTLSDLRETGAIEQDADIVIGLYREAYYVRQKMRSLAPQDSAYAKLSSDYLDCKNRLDVSLLKFRQGSDETYEAYCDMGSSVIRNKGHRRGDIA